MSLLRKIQSLAVDSESDISDLLRQCKILAFRLENDELKRWVDLELNGYENTQNLPGYRIINTNSKGHFVGSFGRELKNGDIPISCIDERFRDDLNQAYATQPISAYQALVKSSKNGENFREQWPADLVAVFAQKIYEGLSCLSAWKEIPYGSIVSLIDVVRNRILNFALEIEAADPKAGDISMNDSLLTPEKVTTVFHNTIYGNVGNLSEGGKNFSQNSTINVNIGDFQSLQNQLIQYGIDEEEIASLKSAIDGDDEKKTKKNKALGSGVTQWIGKQLSKPVNGLKPVVQNISADLIVKAILMYYGIQ
jgi:hypothetical protein